MNKVAAALDLLRDDEHLEKLSAGPGVLSGFGDILRAGDKAGIAASKYLEGRGRPNLAVVARVMPHAAAAYGAKKLYDSDFVQGLKRKYQIHQMNKAVRQQRGY